MLVNMWVSVAFLTVLLVADAVRKTGMECGVEASEKLVHHNPWLVFLEYRDHDRLKSTRCGATLIGPRHVITAAHCVTGVNFDTLIARLGEYDLEVTRECVEDVCTDRVVVIKVTKIVVHPQYAGHGVHDIAVLTLEMDAPYTDFIRPACLPTGELKEDVTFIAAGWGIEPRLGTYSNIKKIVPLPLFKTDACRKAVGQPLPDSVICAGGEEGVDTCNGDSGGPLVWMKGKAELWGVTSIGNTRCGLEGVPAIYTRVADYVDWIRQETIKI